MSVQIIITGGDAAESLLELSTLAKGFNALPVQPPVSVAVPETPKRARKPKEEPVETEVPDSKSAPEEAVPDPDPDIEDGDSPGDPVPSDEDLRALAVEIGKRGADIKKSIKALLDKYGSAKITDLPEGKRVAFKRDLEAL